MNNEEIMRESLKEMKKRLIEVMLIMGAMEEEMLENGGEGEEKLERLREAWVHASISLESLVRMKRLL